MKSKGLIPWFLFGIAAGAILGVLLAPQKGEELREEIRSDLKNWQAKSLIKILPSSLRRTGGGKFFSDLI